MDIAGFRITLSLLALLPAAGRADVVPAALDYADPAHWICRPGRNDVCARDLSATLISAAGALTVRPLKASPAAPVDCFYVYPTVSHDKGVNSDTHWGDGEEIWATYLQAAPLAGGCRLYAPGYRQLTVDSLDSHPLVNDLALHDVQAAWHHYLRHDNRGRVVILIGHSQGSALLKRLIAQEIDGNAALRNRLVAVYLGGVNLQVPPDADEGGDFQEIPLCRSADQTGCVVAWSAYRSTSPPPADALFGKSNPGMQAACTNPAALAGGSADLLPVFPAVRGATIADPTGDGHAGRWVDPATGTVMTPFVLLPGLVSGECRHNSGFGWLELTVNGAPGPRAKDIPGDMSPQWGMHLDDLNVVMGNLQRLVGTQSAAWLRAHPRKAGRRS